MEVEITKFSNLRKDRNTCILAIRNTTGFKTFNSAVVPQQTISNLIVKYCSGDDTGLIQRVVGYTFLIASSTWASACAKSRGIN